MRKQFILLLTLFFPILLISQSVMIEGYVFETGNRGYLAQATVTILDSETKAVKGEVFTDDAGVFQMGLPAGKEYLIRVEKKPFDKMEKIVSTKGKSEGEKVYVKYEMKRMPGYNFEVTLAPTRADEDVVVDAITGARVEVYNNTTEKEELAIESTTSHVFNVRFEQGNHYTILIRKDKFFNKRLEAYVNVKGCILCFDGVGDVRPGVADVLTEGFEMGTLLTNVELVPIEVNKEIEIKNIYYDYNSARIKTAAKAELDKLVVMLKDNNSLLVELGSHTDSRGKTDYNQKLSQRRAQSVVDYLKTKGIERENLIAKGYGESKLVNGCSDGKKCSDEKHQQNRRTELKVVGFLNNAQKKMKTLVQMKEEEKFERMLAELEGSEIKVGEGEEVPDEINRQLNKKEEKKEAGEKIKTEAKKKVDTAKQKVKETTNTSRPSAPKAEKTKVSKPKASKPDTKLPKVNKETKANVVDKKDKVVTKVKEIKPNKPAPKVEQVPVVEPDKSEGFDGASEGVESIEADSKVVRDLDVTAPRELKKPKKLSNTYTGFRVEFTTSLSELPVSHEIFSRHGNIIVEESKDGNYAYLLGDFDDEKDANHFLNNILIKRYPGARVIQFDKGRRVVR